MSIFQPSIINKYQKNLDQKVVSAAYEKFKAYFHNSEIQENIRNSKEEQFQEGFCTEFFCKVLGYTINPNPNFNIITEKKNETGGKKADGAILFNGIVKVVIELKGTETTDLGKIENQAFGYKNNQPECDYVIISNYEKVRFYIDKAIEHIEFNLFTLTEKEFELLYLCLCVQNIERNIPKKIKEESISKELDVTNKLYSDYSVFKKDLHKSLVELNPQYGPLELYQKSQKLLDRFLFLLFAEDRQLLPPNSVRTILKEWKQLIDLDENVPLYDRFKKYFGWLNTGYKGKDYDVFAYNGGLFKSDEILDSIKINNELLYKHTEKLSEYNYSSEVDVNILGHIFENSLNALDELKDDEEGKKTDKSKTKRKKDGVFYTPKYITKYIVENTIGKLCLEKKSQLQINEEDYIADKKRAKNIKQILSDKLTEYRNWLLHLTICDPACGSGAFLNEALEFLITEHKYIDELHAKLFGDAMVMSDFEKSILENNLFGVDINEESVEIAKLSLWLRTAQPNRKLNDLNNNIKCGNSLIDDPAVAGDKAFNWEGSFPQVFEKGGFDVVIGNPPYVNAKGENFSSLDKKYYYEHYKTAVYQIDTYILFIELANRILKKDKLASYIVPNAWLNNLLLSDVRRFVLENFQLVEVVNTPIGVFADATVDTVIFNIGKTEKRNGLIKISEAISNDIIFNQFVNQEIFLNNKNYVIDIFNTSISRAILDKININTVSLESITDSSSGIKEYEVGKGLPKQTEKDRIDKVFNSTFKKDATYLPHLTGSEITNYCIIWNNEYLSYGPWLGAPRNKKFFEEPRLIIREIPGKKRLLVAYTDELYTVKNSAHVFIPKNKNYNIKFLLALLNSRLIGYYFFNKYSEFDSVFPKAKIGQCKELPIKITNPDNQFSFIEKADSMLSLNKNFQALSNKFTTYFRGQYKIEKLNNKLEQWYTLEFANFITELNNAIKIVKGTPLTKKDEFDWIDLFNENKQKVIEVKSKIDATDKEINQMVYKLYQLTEEEIKIVDAT